MSEPSPRGRLPVQTHVLWTLLAFALVAASLLWHINRPLLDKHAWRQADTASFARGLARGEFDVLHPKFLAYYPDEYGIDGATETEFNLYPLIVSWLYRILGVHEWLARLVSAAFSLGTAVWVYLYARRTIGANAAPWAVAALATSPAYAFYGSSVQPEAAVLFLSVGALYCLTLWLAHDRWRDWVAASIMAALAFLTKIPALYMGIPLLAAAFLSRGPRLFRDWHIWAFGACALLPMAAYYLYAHSLYTSTGLTVYGINGGWPGSGKFDTLGELLSLDFYRVMLVRARGILFGPYGFLLLLLGLALRPRWREERLLYIWLGAVVLFIVAVAQGNRQHEYYQLPLVPVAAVFIGKACSRLTRPGAIDLDFPAIGKRAGPLLAAGLLALNLRAGIVNAQPLYAQDSLLLDVAQATQRLSPPDAPVAILHDWARVPEVFYYADRRGWSLWLERTPEGAYGDIIVAERRLEDGHWCVETVLESNIDRLDLLVAQGASRLIVSLEKGTREEFLISPIGRALAERYPLIESAEHWLVYDLTAH